jgi:hypothetical protein
MDRIITKAFDLFVIIPSCLIHVDQRRFENYGGLGQYRETSYGVECRSLGGFFADDMYLGWVFDQALKTLEFVRDPWNAGKLLTLEKPLAEFKGGMFAYDSSVYKILGIDFQEQVIKTEKLLINANN